MSKLRLSIRNMWALLWVLLPVAGLVMAFIFFYTSSGPASQLTDHISLRLHTSDLATGAVAVSPNEFVTLVVTEKGKPASSGIIVSNIQVKDLSAADGHSVAYTGEAPDSVLLEVPRIDIDKVIAALQNEKKVVYLRPQGKVVLTPPIVPAISAVATPTTALASPVFALSGNIQAVEEDIQAEKSVIIILVVSNRDAHGMLVSQETGSYDATLLTNMRASQTPATPPFVRLSVAPTDPDVLEFARQLAVADAIYVLPLDEITIVLTPTP